ncbi:MAG: hypothetical protein ACYC96_05280 [Fimbriimonadaceae bacterium]
MMLLGTFLAVLQADPPGLDQKITIDARGLSGKQLTDELTQKTGIRFETIDAATADRYVVHIENAPLKEALVRIAEAENGEWVRLGANYFRLQRSPEKLAEAHAAEHAALVKRFNLAFDSYRKQLAERPDFSDDAAQHLAQAWRRLGSPPIGIDNSGYWERQNKLERAVPVGRAFMRVLMTFSADELADLPIDTKTAFSTNPTPVQHALSDGAFRALGELVSEQIVWEDAVSKYLPDMANQGWNGMATGGHIRNVTNAMVLLSRWDYNGGIQAQLVLSDKKGNIVTETYLYVDQPNQGQEQPASPTVQPKKSKADVPLSALDKALAQLFAYNSWQVGARLPQVTDAVRAVIEDPEKYDPLSTFVADGLTGIAHQRSENLAAVIDERDLGAYASSVGKKGMSSRLIDNAREWGSEAVDEGNGWLVLREKDPERADELRCDRHALKLMLDAARARGRLTLDDAANYALSSERFNENPIPHAFLTALLDKQGGRTLSDNDPNLLRFYGSLEPAQRANAEHLPLGRLSAFQLGLLGKLVYGNNSNLQIDTSRVTAAGSFEQDDNPWNTTAREPTVSLGDGIPNRGYVKISLENNNAVLAHLQYDGYDQGLQTYDPNSLGWMIAERDFPGSNFPEVVVGMQAANRTQITFEFHYTPTVSQTLQLQDVLATTKETGFVEKLPDDLRKKIQKSIDDAEKQFSQGGGIFYSGVSPAPP